MKNKINNLKATLVFLTILLSGFQLHAQSWMMQNGNYQTNGASPCQLSIVDANLVWTVASIGYFSANTNEFYKTSDGGTTWQAGNVPIPRFCAFKPNWYI